VQRVEQRWEFLDNFSISKGTHNIKFGVDYNLIPLTANFTVNFGGIYDFGSISLAHGTPSLNPIQAYGISKVAGERAALSAHPEGAFVVRSCGLYGHALSRQKSGNFVLNRLADAKTKKAVEVGSDLVCTPTSASDLAGAILALLEREVPAGLYHLTNAGFCDWAAFTAEIYRQAGTATRVVSVDRGGRYAPARRPAYSVLDGKKASAVGVSLRPWQDALAEYVASSI